MNGPDKPFNELSPSELETENKIRAIEELDEQTSLLSPEEEFERFYNECLREAKDADHLFESGTIHLDFSNNSSKEEN